MTLIAPSILAADFSCLKDQLALVENAGADWIHVDIMDGHFVPNLTFGPDVVAAVRKMTGLFLDVHLMVEEPDFIIPRFREAGADMITVQVEAVRHIHRSVQLIQESGAIAGVSLNPGTPASSLKAILPEVHLVLAMTVNPGYGGQKFIHSVVPKITEIADMIHRLGNDIHLQVDGGIDVETTPIVTRAGANVLVAGTSIFRQENIPDAIVKLKQSVAPDVSHIV